MSVIYLVKNPFTFPYRIFPKYANSPESLINLKRNRMELPNKTNK